MQECATRATYSLSVGIHELTELGGSHGRRHRQHADHVASFALHTHMVASIHPFIHASVSRELLESRVPRVREAIRDLESTLAPVAAAVAVVAAAEQAVQRWQQLPART